ncbi:MAG: hypothetical protein JWO91_2991 [Acidobacteriaceae bacterium]|nr:hypothetical protein [Acidobacteriaceae bacterium]
MEAIGHAITIVLLALSLRLLWRSSSFQKAKIEPGRKLFPATKAIRVFVVLAGIVFSALVIGSFFMARKPGEWWVPYLFLGFLQLVLFAYPPLLTIEVDGVESRTWFGPVKKIRWEEIASLHYNSGNNQFTVRDAQERKITHAGFNVDPWGFRSEIQARTRLPLQVAEPGIWKTKTLEIPYEEDEVTLD